MTHTVRTPPPALVVELAVLFPSVAPEADIDRARLLIEKLREFGADVTVQVERIRWSKLP